MKFVVILKPGTDSDLRLQGEHDSLLGAIEFLTETVVEYGSPRLMAEFGLELTRIQEKALRVEVSHPVEDLMGLIRELRDRTGGGLAGAPMAWMVERLEAKNGRDRWTHTTGDLVMNRNAACHREEHHQKLGFVTRSTPLSPFEVGR